MKFRGETMNKKFILGILILVILSAIIGVSLSGNEDTIKIGSILSLSGVAGSWGEAAQNGINLAVEEINSKGGVLRKQVEIIYEDDQSDAVKTVTSFNKLTDLDGIKFLIGASWTKFGLSIKDLIDDEVFISPSLGGSAFNENNDWIFNSRQHDYILSINLAEYVYNQGHRSVAVLSVNDPYNKEQADEFKKTFENLGGTVIYLFEPQMEEKDVQTDLLKVKNNSEITAMVATTGATPLTTLFAVQMKELDMKYPVYSLSIDQTRINESKGAIDGWIGLSSFTPTKEFSEKYKKNMEK